MKILVACEFSQIVTKAFREKGHEAYSCDIIPCEGGHPEWHIQDDVLNHLNNGYNMMIAHPPCTYLTLAGNKWMKPEFEERFPNRRKQRNDAIIFFMNLIYASIDKIVIENPIGIMSTYYRKPDQIISPYQFGHSIQKRTCLWIKNLPKLKPTNIVDIKYDYFKSGKRQSKWHTETGKIIDKEKRSKERSKTFLGIADAMANQWG